MFVQKNQISVLKLLICGMEQGGSFARRMLLLACLTWMLETALTNTFVSLLAPSQCFRYCLN